MISKYAGRDSSHGYSPVFIIGLPRSGSTLLYQLVTDMFDVTYFDNLINLGRENIHFALSISNLLFRNRPHQSYRSNYGNTSSDGLHAPAEAGPLWYRWFPENVSEVTPELLSSEKMVQLRDTIESIVNREGKPLVIKNLYMILRMQVLREVFPDARYIYIRRDPLFVAQSIYFARQKNLEDIRAEWWSVPFPGHEALLGSPAEKQIAHQVVALQRIIDREIKEINKNNIFMLDYESLDLQMLRTELGDFLNALPRKSFSAENVDIHNRNSKMLPDEILQKLQSEMNGIFDA